MTHLQEPEAVAMPSTDCLRIAMWSGPRNISTAMMRSWGSRPDTYVCDEPLYAHYLMRTQHRSHPGFEETISQHETDWQRVVETLLAPPPPGKSVFYQKHMAHHLYTGIDLDWTESLTNVLLIRQPADMLTSLLELLPEVKVGDTGLPQQQKLFEHLQATRNTTPVVIDSRDVLENPGRKLEKLCESVGLEYSDCMLRWESGLRETDGAWAPYWYDKVKDTTGFATYRPKPDKVPEDMLPVLAECQEIYNRLHQHRLH